MLGMMRSKGGRNSQVPFTNGYAAHLFFMKWPLDMGKAATYDTCLQLVRFESDDMEDIRFHGRFS